MVKYKKHQWNLVWLKSAAVRLIWKILSSNGNKVYFVGGCVRDSIQGREIKDVDISTDALPSRVIEMVEAAGLKVIKTGFEHGSVKVLIEQDSFEVTTFRSDLVTDGRHSKVSFSRNILDDASRRDFTMNAIYMTIDGDILDPLYGWEDLVNGYVRFIGKPEKRIKEDYLRILRYFRFISTYGEHINYKDDIAVQACSEAIEGLKTLSQSRIWEELQKILLAADPYPVLKLMKVSKILDEILPSANIECLANFLKIERKVKLEAIVMNRLLALNVNSVRFWVEKFPLTKEQCAWVSKVLISISDNSSPKVKGYKYGMNLALVSLALVNANSFEKFDQNDLADIKLGCSKKFPLSSSDLLEFFSPSKELGDELKRLKVLWFDSDLELDRNDLLANLQMHLKFK